MGISISVVLPYYNGSQFIEATLASVLKQTFSPLEVIIIDDGSHFEEARYLDRFKDKRISIIHQENAGVSVARNMGVANARGDWIAFIDQDDQWEPSKLDLQRRYIEDHPDCKAVHTAVKSISAKGNIVNHRKKQLSKNDFLLSFPNPSYLSSTLISKTSIIKAGLFNPTFKYSQSTECFLRCSLFFPFHYLDELVTIRILHGTNLSANSRGVWREGVRIVRLYENEFENETEFRRKLYSLHRDFSAIAIKKRNWNWFLEILSELSRDNFSRIVLLFRVLIR